MQSLGSHVDGLLQVMDRRMSALEADLLILTERVRQLEGDGGGQSQDARLTDAAILEGRERLAQLKDEVEQLRAQLPKDAAGKRPVSRGS
jgi:uncharacterized small protein (DUF1192 family)